MYWLVIIENIKKEEGKNVKREFLFGLGTDKGDCCDVVSHAEH